MRSIFDLAKLVATAYLPHVIQAAILPPHCIRCGSAGQPPVLDLCEYCEEELPLNGCACRHCGLPLPAGSSPVCAACSRRARAFDAVFAPYLYGYPVDRLIQQFKYDGRLEVGRVLATLLVRALAARDGERPDALLPVPLAPSKERERGFNQALELAQPIASSLGIPIRRRLCSRMRATEDQAGLRARERRRNLRGAFVAAASVPRHIAIIDDVLTTGSTCEEIARVLKTAGAERVDVWVVARARGSKDQ